MCAHMHMYMCMLQASPLVSLPSEPVTSNVPPAGSAGATAPSTAASTRRTTSLSHHLAGIVTAAVFADAAHIVEEIVLLKTRVMAAAAADPTE